jgi:predicted acyl esterase
VGLNGVVFLAISQFHVAACQFYGRPPPSLCCISSWEGLTDPYRDIFCFGGVEESGFPTFWWNTKVKPVINGTEEDFAEFERSIATDYLRDHPFYDDFWTITVIHTFCCNDTSFIPENVSYVADSSYSIQSSQM